MSELERLLRRIEIAKRRGENRLRLDWEVEDDTVIALMDMGYLVLQVYEKGYIDTIVGWGNND